MAALLDIVVKGTTDRSVTLRIVDSGDGTPETGVVFNTSGIDLWYRREGAAKTSITEADLATPALTDAHADGGFLHIGDGEYRLDLPDAAFASGANYVDVGGTVTGMVVIGGRVRLVDFNIESARVLLTSSMRKGVETTINFLMKDSTNHAPATGLTVSVEVSTDLANFAAATNSVTEEGGGWYSIVVTASEMNGDEIKLSCTASGADATEISIRPDQ